MLRGDIAVAAVPEPGTYMLMFTGLLAMTAVAQRRRQRGGQRRSAPLSADADHEDADAAADAMPVDAA